MSNVPMTRPDLMVAMHEDSYGHSSTFVDLPDGRIMHSVGSHRWLSDDGGLTWGERIPCIDEAGEQISGTGPSIVKLSRGIGLFAARVRTPDLMSRGIFFWRSRDDGITWEEPKKIHVNWFFPHPLQNAALRLKSGRILIGVYSEMKHELPREALERRGSPQSGGLLPNGQWVNISAHFFDRGHGGCWVIYSDDDGDTWQCNRDGQLFPWIDWERGLSGGYEPTITEVRPGKLLMFIRTDLGRLYQSVSEDDGETWTEPAPTDLASDHSPAALATIPDTGHLLCVWTQHNEEDIKQGRVRTRLSSAVSRSEGFVWEHFQNVESIYEETRVPPGPIHPCRPVETYEKSVERGCTWDPEYVKPLAAGFGKWSYPSLHVSRDHALIAYPYARYDDDGAHVRGARLKVLPLEWFYGGRDRFKDNPHVDKIFEPAKP